MKNRGITLVALIVTIIVLLILAGVTIAMLVGENGIISQSMESKFKNNVSAIREQLKIYISQKYYDDINFRKEQINGNLSTIPDISQTLAKDYGDRLIISGGDLIYSGNNAQEIQWCIELGIKTEETLNEINKLEAIIGDNKESAIENKYIKKYQYPYQLTGAIKTNIETEIGRPIDYSKDRFYEVNEENVLGTSYSGKQYIFNEATGDVIEIKAQTNRIKGTWFWVSEGDKMEQQIMNDTDTQNEFFEKLSFYNINEIYIFQSSSDITIENSSLRSFIKNAYSKDIKVYLLVGDTDYLDDDKMNLMINQLYDDLDSFNKNVEYNERIAGVSYDAEVWLNTDYAWTENIETRNKHIQFINKTVDYANSKSLEAIFTIPFWLVQYDVTENGTTINMFDKITQIAERINILAYRDTKEAINSLVIEKQEGAPDSLINYAKNNECILDVGVETAESSEGDNITFYEEETNQPGSINMVLAEVEQGFKNICDSQYIMHLC